MSLPLEGYLKKMGEKGPRQSFKKRYFKQLGNKLYYFVNKSSHQEKGFIDLHEGKSSALSSTCSPQSI